MLSLLLHLLFNPGALMGLVVLAAIAAGIYFTLGPVKLLKIATDIRTWFVIGAVLLFLAYAHAEKRADKLEKDIQAASQQHTSDQDAQKTTQLRVVQKTKRQAQTSRLQETIDHAQPGQEEDALLDSLGEDYARSHPSVPPTDGVRKRPDGAVVP